MKKNTMMLKALKNIGSQKPCTHLHTLIEKEGNCQVLRVLSSNRMDTNTHLNDENTTAIVCRVTKMIKPTQRT